MQLNNNTLSIGGKTTTLSPEQMKDLGIEVGGRKRRKRADYGKEYYYLNILNTVKHTTEKHYSVDNELYDTGNHFLTEAECHAEKMRVESARARWGFVPKKGDLSFYWNFEYSQVREFSFNVFWTSHWNIGAVHRTKEECEAWGAKYAEYFKLPV